MVQPYRAHDSYVKNSKCSQFLWEKLQSIQPLVFHFIAQKKVPSIFKRFKSLHSLQSFLYRGRPIMIATTFPMGTKQDCNLDRKRDQLLQCSSRKKLNMTAMMMRFGTIYDCNHRKFVCTRFFQKSQSLDSRASFVIAIIFGAFLRVCNHIKSPVSSSLQSY